MAFSSFYCGVFFPFPFLLIFRLLRRNEKKARKESADKTHLFLINYSASYLSGNFQQSLLLSLLTWRSVLATCSCANSAFCCHNCLSKRDLKEWVWLWNSRTQIVRWRGKWAQDLGNKHSFPPSCCVRSRQRHKEGSVAFTVVVLFQGGIFLCCFEGLFHGTLHRINAAHHCIASMQQMGAMCTRPVTGQAFVFPACQGLSVLSRHWTSCPAAHHKRLSHNLNFVQRIRVYSIDSVGAYLRLESWQNIFWFCQHSGHDWLTSIRCWSSEMKLHPCQGSNYLLFYLFFLHDWMHIKAWVNAPF